MSQPLPARPNPHMPTLSLVPGVSQGSSPTQKWGSRWQPCLMSEPDSFPTRTSQRSKNLGPYLTLVPWALWRGRGKEGKSKKGKQDGQMGEQEEATDACPWRPHANPARKRRKGAAISPQLPELVLLFTGKQGRGRDRIAGLSLPPGVSCTKLSVVREQWARHRRQKWASCCRVKDSQEPSEAFSGEVDSSGSRVECSVDQGKTAGRPEKRPLWLSRWEKMGPGPDRGMGTESREEIRITQLLVILCREGGREESKIAPSSSLGQLRT